MPPFKALRDRLGFALAPVGLSVSSSHRLMVLDEGAASDREQEHRRKMTLQAPQVIHIPGVDHAATSQGGRRHHDGISKR